MWRSPVIDEEAERPRTRSRAKLEVKRARNAQNSISISLLPPEILLLIFLAVKDAHSGDHGTGSPEKMDWVRVTHVCHHWRVVALKAPTLWTTLSITSSSSRRHWARLAIDRSKHALLSAYVECLSPWDQQWSESDHGDYLDTISLLASDLLRCRTLSLRFIDEDDVNRPPNLLFEHHHAPKLHSLAILFPDDQLNPLFKLSDKTLSAPSLKHLELNNCRVDWHSTLFQSITYLKIDRMVHSRLYLPEFISALSSMSYLQELDTDMTPFYLVAPDEPADAPSIHTFPRTTTLTKVNKITLMATITATTAFFSSFRSLHNAHIFATATSRSPLQFFERFDRLLRALSFHFPSTANCTGSPADTESLPFRSLRLGHSNSGLSIQAFHSTLQLWDIACIPVGNLQLGALNIFIPTEHFTSPFEPQFMRSVFTGLPFDDLVSANVLGGFTFDTTVWADTFGRIARLQSILLTSVNIAEFFDSLVYGLEESNTEASPADQKMRVPFPSLDTVLVLCIAELQDSIVESINSVLQRREEIGKPVSSVVLLEPGRAKSGRGAVVILRSTIPEEKLKRDMIKALQSFHESIRVDFKI